MAAQLSAAEAQLQQALGEQQQWEQLAEQVEADKSALLGRCPWATLEPSAEQVFAICMRENIPSCMAKTRLERTKYASPFSSLTRSKS